MIRKKLTTNNLIVGVVLVAILSTMTVASCTDGIWHGEDQDADRTTQSEDASEREMEGSGGEHDSRREGSESSDEHGSSVNSSDGSESNEAAMSSPITPLEQSWNGILGPLAIDARYDPATQSIISTVQNKTSHTLCYVQAEPHLKSGTTTVGELGPDKLGDLNPGQTTTTNVSVYSEPALVDVAFDGYVVHMEVFDCAGPGPQPHTSGEGSESGNEEGSTANMLAPDETFDMIRGGARLILNYDAQSNSFKGMVENTTNGVLNLVRIEVHLSNGVELGPTTPTNMDPGKVIAINLPATQAPFTGWVAHAEVGGGEGGGEHGSAERESSGEHGSGRESDGEHGSGGERREGR